MNKNEGTSKLILDIISGLFLIGIASLCLLDTVHAFFGMTHITFWDASTVIFLLYSVKLVLRGANE